MAVAEELAAAGVRAGEPLALAVLAGRGIALAWASGSRTVPTEDPAQAVAELLPLDPRWTWWSARETARPLVEAGLHLRACWDLGAVARLAHGLARDDPASVWAAHRGLPPPPVRLSSLNLLDLTGETGDAVRADGHLSREWLDGGWASDLDSAATWARLAIEVQQAQEKLLLTLPDRRAVPRRPTLPMLTAYAESAAALLAVELEHIGLPVDRAVAADLLRAAVGERPADADDELRRRRERDEPVHAAFPEPRVDLRNPQQVRGQLARIGLDLPDTRSWRLEPHAPSSPAVAAMLAWRKAERLATTYGWSWLDRHVSADGRLRGTWGAADAAAGRMTAQAGLHNLPAELRVAVRAEPGHVLVRADLGQVEPRVLAVVSGDEGLAQAARDDDMYAPVAAALGCDRATAKVSVLAAMYGQTSGTAGAALRDLDRAYPRAMAYLRDAEASGRAGRDLRTYGGRLLPVSRWHPGDAAGAGQTHGIGRFARNAVVQGAAAELFKAWAATVRSGLGGAGGIGGEIVLCLHDELLLHVPIAVADRAETWVREALAATAGWWAAGSPVRFVADVASGDSWAAAH